MGTDVPFGERVIANVSPKLTLGGNEGHPIQFEVGVSIGLESLDVAEGAIDGA